MKRLLLITTLLIGIQALNAQTSCYEIMEYVKSESYGSTYYSFDSEAISQVTFYEITDDSYNTFYFATVQFTSSYNEYIYQVGSNTKFNYSMDYMNSSGKAFWQHIQPYSDVLDCSPSFD